MTGRIGCSASESGEGDPNRHLKCGLPRKKGAYFCLACVEQDKAVLGFSYWRRTHQIPGIDHCVEHCSPLMFIESSFAFLNTPHYWLSVAQPLEPDLMEVGQSSLVIRRYAQIAVLFMNADHRLSATTASTSLLSIAMRLNIRVTKLGDEQTLVRLLKREFPRSWLCKHFPVLAHAGRFPDIFHLDGRCKAQSSRGQVYSMILATAFTDVQAAMKEFCLSEESRGRFTYQPPINISYNRQLLLRVYIRYEGRHRLVWKAWKKGGMMLPEKLKALGFPPLDYLDDLPRTQIIKFLSQANELQLDIWTKKVLDIFANGTRKITTEVLKIAGLLPV